MTKSETTTPRVNVELIEKYQLKGRKITHNPKCSFNDALYAVLGRLEELERRERVSRVQPAPTTVRLKGQSPVDGKEPAPSEAEPVGV